uniref:Ig-like domain-containing protein n=1 Tax=Cyprinodon variegatus TaxID=28743 RepID=A0A3Q2D912_CYPVA
LWCCLTFNLCALLCFLSYVILPCKVTDHPPVTAVEWTREDLKEEHVFCYENNKVDPVGQDPSYKDRVDLLDREMDGDLSVVLKNVTPDDNGIYECQLERESLDPTPICSIQLFLSHDLPDRSNSHLVLLCRRQ